MKTVKTFTATIYVGRKKRLGALQPSSVGYRICQSYCNEVGLCVTLTPTKFIYTNGGESGFAVGLINYPRFPAEVSTIRKHALELAERLKSAYAQYRVTVVFPNKTIMLGGGRRKPRN